MELIIIINELIIIILILFVSSVQNMLTKIKTNYSTGVQNSNKINSSANEQHDTNITKAEIKKNENVSKNIDENEHPHDGFETTFINKEVSQPIHSP